ncbi:MAG: hypothetical protein E6Q97_26185 [Desulfurellales bacterium]|nr:MAG: hypothetical protein E6Q97_26185 [Desulfurellales bacterium]
MTPSELRRRLLDLGVTPELSRDGRALWLDGLADEIADELVDEIVPSNVPWQPRAVSNQSGSGANPDLLVGDLVDVCRDEAATTDVEYRQGIPNHVHIEAATRLGLLWQRQGYSSRTLFRLVNGVVHSDFGFGSNPTEDSAGPLFIYERQGHYRPVRANGTPVAWSVLDAAAELRLARGSHVSPTNPHVRIVVESNRTAANVVAQINRSVGTQVAHLPSAPGVTMSSAEARRIQEEVDRRLVTTLQSIEPGAIVTWGSGVTITHESSKLPAPASPILPTPPTPPTRFSLLELDDDIVTAKPTLLHTDGKAPTAVQVRRYRDAMESRIGVDLTKAAKDAQLDEVAVYILHRWLRGLDDVTVVDCIRFVHLSLDLSLGPKQVSQALLDERCEAWLQRYLKPTLDTREPVDTATQRRRQDVEEQRRRLADLAAKLAQERAADTTAPTEVTRWSLLELDGAAPVIEPTPMPAPQPAPDPLTVWWSRRAAQLAKRPAPSRFRIYLPPVPKRIDDWTTLPTELRDAALSYYVVVKGLEGLLN